MPSATTDLGLREIVAGSLGEPRRDLARLALELLARAGQRDVDDARVVVIPPALDEPVAREPLEQRRQRAAIEPETRAELADRTTVALPQREQHEVLRVRHAERLEQWSVRARQRPLRRVQREAQLVVEREEVVGGLHASLTSTTMLLRVAFEYGQTSCAVLTSASAWSYGRPGIFADDLDLQAEALVDGADVDLRGHQIGPALIFCIRATWPIALPKQAA